MTPEREKYLKAISSKERAIRHALKMAKFSLAETKEWWTKHKYTKPSKINGYKKTVKRQKATVMALCHELQRIKGMDRVVVPYELMRFGFKANVPRVSYNCECLEPINRKYKYCPKCGRKILWEKVK